ncbi:MAG: M48 family metallopeptidase [Phycisphaerales bacterium]|nr:M48 family metallopeptidase [Phycisphaerales bacterium]
MPFPFSSRRATGSRPRIPIKIIIALLIAGFVAVRYFSSSSSNPVTGQTQRVALTPEQERALGLQAAPEMAQQMGGLSRDAGAAARVKQVGRSIVSAFTPEITAFAKDYQFEYHLLADTKTVNAFALPGGQIFITEALYGRLETEGQLAGVLGHETGHVLGRHSAQQMAKGQLLQGLVGAATVAGSDASDGGRTAQAASAMVANMLQLKYGRGDELEADKLGLTLMRRAGYDPRAMVDVMRILEKASSGSQRQPEFASSHPNPGNRIEAIQAELQRMFPSGVPAGLKP